MSLKDEQAEKIVVAMSGGVDSCASALMLAEAGYSIIGVAMQVWDYRKNGGNSSRATCCAPSDFDDAREIADARNFPFYVFDFEDSFHESVIRPFVESYLSGKTPNPCLDCNRKVKFHQLRGRAAAFGAKKVATGHYAQIRETENGRLGLFTAVDRAKDQSYFLYALTQADLATTAFPVGGYTKPEVREYLASRGFAVSSKSESQDICFVASSVGEFIQKESGRPVAGGVFRSRSGDVLGTHDGIYNYTVGQRRGLGLSAENPLYVLDIDHSTNTVTVGEKAELERPSFFVEDVNWISGVSPLESFVARVKLRYRHGGVLCDVRALPDARAQVTFRSEWSAVSPGQAAVFYRETDEADGAVEVLGGGRISKQAQDLA